jgi:hypothetical protein
MSAFTDIYGNDIDFLELDDQYRFMLDLPGGDHIAPEVRKRMIRTGETVSQALAKMCIHPPRNPNSLPRELYNAPSLLDDEHWEEVLQGLRKKGMYMMFLKVKEANVMKGVKLPCDDVFGNGERMAESFGSNETIPQAGVTRRSRPVMMDKGRDKVPRMATQSQRKIVWELLVEFWRAVLGLAGRVFARG